MPFAETPEPPYVAVIFTSVRTTEDDEGYAAMAAAMDELAREQPGFLGIESAREGIGITVSYWRDAASAAAWKQVSAHRIAQQRGRERWYADYRVRIAEVHREYGPYPGLAAADALIAEHEAVHGPIPVEVLSEVDDFLAGPAVFPAQPG